MRLRRNLMIVLAAAASSACHIAPAAHVPHYDRTHTPEPLPILPRAPAPERFWDRSVLIPKEGASEEARLREAAVSVIDGSRCSVTAAPLCASAGCLATVRIHGGVCVLLVRQVSDAGRWLEPYCHDLSPAGLRGLPHATPLEQQSVWEECLEGARELKMSPAVVSRG